MTDYQLFLGAMEAIEDASKYEGRLVAHFEDDSAYFVIDEFKLRVVAEQYRKLEKEHAELENQLFAMKRRIECVLEDF